MDRIAHAIGAGSRAPIAMRGITSMLGIAGMRRIAAIQGVAGIVLGLTLALLPCFSAHATGAEPRVALAPFFSHADYGSLHLSPSGKYLGALVPVQGRLRLAVLDLDAGTHSIAAGVDGSDIVWFHWVNDKRLVFTVADLQAGLGEQIGGGLFAIDRDGNAYRELAPTLGKVINENQYVYRYSRFLALPNDGSDDVLVESNELDVSYPDVYRVNTRSGRRTLLTAGKPGDVIQWIADTKGAVRGAVTIEKASITRAFWRDTADGPWKELGTYGLRDPEIVPVDFDADGSLLVASDVGRETRAIYRYDAKKKTLGDMLAGHPQADMSRSLVHDPVTQRVVGIHYEADRPGSAWFDIEWARLQRTVDTALPDHVNRLERAGHRVLVDSFSDRDPGTYYLLDLDKRRLEPVAIRRKAIKPEAMPGRQPARYHARDGLEIPAYVTLPPGKENAKNLPLVLYVHGGPWVRGGHWRWNPEAAYLASLGYAVLEPDFRGSTGWGRKLYLAGWKQWGLAMQDDLDDGVKWLASRGTIDPKRVCIMGASYGGYAVMMGLARDPDLFRCGINYVGVTDIRLMFDVTWSDMADTDFIRYSAKEMIGDPDRDGAQLDATSPLHNAAKIKRPVLMAYGAVDRRVPLIHGERMRDALTGQGTPVEWIVYTDEGHGFMLEENRYDFYGRVAKFLDRNLSGSAR